MVVAEEKNFLKTETTCVCGKKAEQRLGSRQFFIGTRKIIVHNVPHFYCEYCDKAIYEKGGSVDKLLKYAYKKGMSEIDWDNKCMYV